MIEVKEKQVVGGRIRTISKKIMGSCGCEHYAEFSYSLTGVTEADKIELDKMAEEKVSAHVLQQIQSCDDEIPVSERNKNHKYKIKS